MKDNFTISEEIIKKLLQKYNLDRFSTLREIKTGLINSVFVINGQYVLRINGKKDFQSKEKFEKEAYLYALLSKSDIPTPRCIAYDCSNEIIKEDYLLISYIEGETLTEAFKRADKETKYYLAYRLGEIANKIHSVNVGEISSKNDLFEDKESWYKRVELEFAEYFELAKKKQLLSEKVIESIEAVSKEFALLDSHSEKVTFIHGDFSCNNFQVRNGEIVGVFDFEMASLGDPYYDLQKLPINFQLGDEFDKNAFLAGYGQKVMSAKERIRLKRYALLQGLWELWATETQQFPFGKKEIEEGKNLILKTLEM